MITGTFSTTISGVEVMMTVSTVSATLIQLAAWNQLWGRLLAGLSASGMAVSGSPAPAATGDGA